jgi:hypothetical protein
MMPSCKSTNLCRLLARGVAFGGVTWVSILFIAAPLNALLHDGQLIWPTADIIFRFGKGCIVIAIGSVLVELLYRRIFTEQPNPLKNKTKKDTLTNEEDTDDPIIGDQWKRPPK